MGWRLQKLEVFKDLGYVFLKSGARRRRLEATLVHHHPFGSEMWVKCPATAVPFLGMKPTIRLTIFLEGYGVGCSPGYGRGFDQEPQRFKTQ